MLHGVNPKSLIGIKIVTAIVESAPYAYGAASGVDGSPIVRLLVELQPLPLGKINAIHRWALSLRNWGDSLEARVAGFSVADILQRGLSAEQRGELTGILLSLGQELSEDVITRLQGTSEAVLPYSDAQQAAPATPVASVGSLATGGESAFIGVERVQQRSNGYDAEQAPCAATAELEAIVRRDSASVAQAFVGSRSFFGAQASSSNQLFSQHNTLDSLGTLLVRLQTAGEELLAAQLEVRVPSAGQETISIENRRARVERAQAVFDDVIRERDEAIALGQALGIGGDSVFSRRA